MALIAVGALALGGTANYTVRDGETLSEIAARNNVTVESIVRASALTDPDVIHPGQQLYLVGASAGATEHVVDSGETLSMLATRFGVSVDALVKANDLPDPDRLQIGQHLRIPDPAAEGLAVHEVAAGDTLTKLAATYGVSVETIRRANEMVDADRITVGRTLLIPAEDIAPAPADAPVDDEPVAEEAVDEPVAEEAVEDPEAEEAPAEEPVAEEVVDDPVADEPAPDDAPVSTDREDIGALIGRIADEYGWNPAFFKAVAWYESGWDQDAVSDDGAIGVMQVLPSTGEWVSTYLVDRELDLTDPVDNIEAAVAFMDYLYQLTDGDPELVLGGYYQGLVSIEEEGMWPETERYVADVLALREDFD